MTGFRDYGPSHGVASCAKTLWLSTTATSILTTSTSRSSILAKSDATVCLLGFIYWLSRGRPHPPPPSVPNGAQDDAPCSGIGIPLWTWRSNLVANKFNILIHKMHTIGRNLILPQPPPPPPPPHPPPPPQFHPVCLPLDYNGSHNVLYDDHQYRRLYKLGGGY